MSLSFLEGVRAYSLFVNDLEYVGFHVNLGGVALYRRRGHYLICLASHDSFLKVVSIANSAADS